MALNSGYFSITEIISSGSSLLKKSKPCVQFVLDTLIVKVFLKDVKGDKKIFLKKIQLQTCVKLLSRMMQIYIWKVFESLGAAFQKYNCINGFDIPVGKKFLLTGIADSFVLAKKKI